MVFYMVGENLADDLGEGRLGLDPGDDYEADDLAVRLYDAPVRNSLLPVLRTREAAEREFDQSMSDLDAMFDGEFSSLNSDESESAASEDTTGGGHSAESADGESPSPERDAPAEE